MEHIELNSVSWMGHKHNMAETGKKVWRLSFYLALPH